MAARIQSLPAGTVIRQSAPITRLTNVPGQYNWRSVSTLIPATPRAPGFKSMITDKSEAFRLAPTAAGRPQDAAYRILYTRVLSPGMQKAKADRQHDIDEHPLMRLALAGIRGWPGVLERNFAYLPKARRE